jgi:FAD binding domain
MLHLSFCNELGRRDYVTDMVFSLNETYSKTRVWKGGDEKVPRTFLLLSEEGASSIQKHIDFYVFKGFLTKVKGVHELADYIGVTPDTIRGTLQEYQTAALGGLDAFGKDRFPGVPPLDDDAEVYYYIGRVEPVLHYCMGGIRINPQGQVIKDQGTVIPGLYAVGEVAGGLHGKNRLAGNSLCECVVFGRIVGHGIVDCRNTAHII